LRRERRQSPGAPADVDVLIDGIAGVTLTA
jgi:hypothetical protein